MIKTGPEMTAGENFIMAADVGLCGCGWSLVTTNEQTDEWLLSFLEVSHGAI